MAGVLLAEATNLCAKLLAPGFYELKGPAVCAAALHPRVQSGWGSDGCFHISTTGAGELCMQMRPSQGGRLARRLGLTGPWTGSLYGVRRQEAAFLAIASPQTRQLHDQTTRERL